MYDGTDFILQVREVRLILTHIDPGYIFKLLYDFKHTTVSSNGCLLTDVPSLFVSERDVPSKRLKYYKIRPRSLPTLESSDEET